MHKIKPAILAAAVSVIYLQVEAARSAHAALNMHIQSELGDIGKGENLTDVVVVKNDIDVFKYAVGEITSHLGLVGKSMDIHDVKSFLGVYGVQAGRAGNILQKSTDYFAGKLELGAAGAIDELFMKPLEVVLAKADALYATISIEGAMKSPAETYAAVTLAKRELGAAWGRVYSLGQEVLGLIEFGIAADLKEIEKTRTLAA